MPPARITACADRTEHGSDRRPPHTGPVPGSTSVRSRHSTSAAAPTTSRSWIRGIEVVVPRAKASDRKRGCPPIALPRACGGRVARCGPWISDFSGFLLDILVCFWSLGAARRMGTGRDADLLIVWTRAHTLCSHHHSQAANVSLTDSTVAESTRICIVSGPGRPLACQLTSCSTDACKRKPTFVLLTVQVLSFTRQSANTFSNYSNINKNALQHSHRVRPLRSRGYGPFDSS